ncbi:MAG: type II toxin-antitoxin system VapC family toxin [Coriobacteriaceae bacterium]|jgi:PIN domain nuclease of toxin-antitoxin system|nr:type II toxin-antitoxin system VapC family toxin [Coriobacteriaceae bacterium]
MSYLADTCILIWALNQPQRLTHSVRAILEDTASSVYYSPISLWEIAIKHGMDKLDLRGHTPEEFLEGLQASFFQCLPLEAMRLASSYRLPKHHRDPFDRMLFWEAIENRLILLSADSSCEPYQAEGLKFLL